jgi:hypothetical protein
VENPVELPMMPLSQADKTSMPVVSSRNAATRPNCGNPLRAFDTKPVWKHIGGRQLEVWYGKNSKDWAIRSQAPKLVKTRVWRRFRDYMEVGPRNLVNSDEGLRYSPATCESLWIIAHTAIK